MSEAADFKKATVVDSTVRITTDAGHAFYIHPSRDGGINVTIESGRMQLAVFPRTGNSVSLESRKPHPKRSS